MKRIAYIPALICVFVSAHVFAGEDASSLLPADALLTLKVSSATVLKKALLDSDFAGLVAEPEVQLFLKPIRDEISAKLKQQMLPMMPKVADLEACFKDEFVVSLNVVTDPIPMPCVNLAARVGDPAALGRILAPFLGGRELTEGDTLEPLPGVKLVYQKPFLMFSTQPDGLNQMKKRLGVNGDSLATAKNFVAAEKVLGGAGHVTLSLDIQRLLSLWPQIKELFPDKDDADKFDKIVKLSGLEKTRSVALQLGSRGTLLTFDSAVAFHGQPSGFAAMLQPKPVKAELLKIVPDSAEFCSASHFDAQGLFKAIRGALDANTLKNFDDNLAQFNQTLGLNIEKDLLGSIGENWIIYETGINEFFGLLPGVCVVVDLKDTAAATKSIGALLNLLEKELMRAQGPFGPPMAFNEVKLNDVSVKYFTVAVMPFSPSIAITKDKLLLTFSVNGMRRALANLNCAKDITSSEEFKEAISRVSGKPLDINAIPAFSFYGRPRHGISAATLAGLGQMISGSFLMEARMMNAFGGNQNPQGQEAAVQEIVSKVNFALFPSEEAILRHIKPTASAALQTEGGIVYRSDLTVPNISSWASGQNMFFTAGAVAAVAVPNLMRSRVAANETVAAASCKAYAEAQEIFHRTDWDQDGVLEYAQTLKGNVKPKVPEVKNVPEPTPEESEKILKLAAKLGADDFGEREAASGEILKLGPKAIKPLEKLIADSKDAEVRSRCQAVVGRLKMAISKNQPLDTRTGLYSKENGEGEICCIDKSFAEAEGNPSDNPKPKAGYCFKILTAQMDNGVRKSYFDHPDAADPTQRNMTLGYAIIAYPAKYGETGMNCFIISNAGTIYQKDLGPETHKVVEELDVFDPKDGWVPAE